MRFFIKREPRGIMVVDWDNLQFGLDPDELNEASVIGGFDKIVKIIAREFGEIVDVFVFLPPQAAYTWGETLYKLGFYPIVCPKVMPKEENKEKDTVDNTLIELSRSLIANIKDLSFFCLVSGDRDFNPIIRKVMRRGLKIIVVASSLRSLSRHLLPPKTDRTYIFELANPE